MTNQYKIEVTAKWLACIVENGEAYENFRDMAWGEFAGGEASAEGYRELAREVIQLFEPKDEGLREEIKGILDEIVSLVQTGTMLQHHFGEGLKDTKTTTEYATQILLKAQAHCDKRVDEIFEEIEKHMAIEKLPYRDGGYTIRIIPDDAWQALQGKGEG